MADEQFKRNTAFKLRIGDILRGKTILEEAGEGERQRFRFLELGGKEIIRVNVIANVIDRFESEGEKKFSSFTVDDGSGQLRIRMFGEDVNKFSDIGQGDTIMVIGNLRFFNNEIYVLPEIIRKKDPRFLLVRKLELEGERQKEVKEVPKEEIKALKDQIVEMIKGEEENGGVETEKLILELKAEPELINQEVQKLLEEGLAYEPRPGVIRYLG